MDPAPKDFPLWTKGRYYEGFEVGQTFDHHWGRTLRDYDSVLFNSLTLSYAPIYNNDEYARNAGLPRSPINPYLVFLLVLGMSVEDTSEGVDGADGAFLGVERADFLAPVYPEDTITSHTEVVGLRTSRSRPQGGIATWRTIGRNQHGETVLELVRTNLVAREGSAS